MLYKITGEMYVTALVYFRREINGKLIEYHNDGNIIRFVIYETEEPIDPEILERYGLNAELITNLK
ncbi:hypothetical protein BR63_03235 [Thermanaerosceptrum fracticalcis]|jgi:hypothetical protein|uniref:Uncharacterized protein n=1 Tax=Thermanaerosceptrum fracticalcis TaxID=1712410 RepID=A0A7G6E010_THEFR|nr:hypothetical protein [Thermanaerosceptrum fracticalcis]QNB45414.1 hypothetical protein BR63_03235 [Thermanaerosceptrum fracticalcis]